MSPDIPETLHRGRARQRVLIVGVKTGKTSRRRMEQSMEELARLVDTAGGVVVGSAHQDVRRIDPATFIGRGKAFEIAGLARDVHADLVVIDEDLSPVQNRNLETYIGVIVLDRTAIILDIFALRAKTTDGRLQVELAQLEYLAPRLIGRGKMLSQQAGRIGTRGPGETALEYDRRRIRDRITLLKRNLVHLSERRKVQRFRRASVPVPLVSLVGYTNAGKSTLMNVLTDANAFVEDKLFATLDPTVRRLRLSSGRIVLVADTVGFIRRLPHELVESFKSTFEEVAHSHLIIHVIDGSDEDAASQKDVVEAVLANLGLNHKPRIDVVNKCDRDKIFHRGDKSAIRISALRHLGIDELILRLDEMLRTEFIRTVLKLPMDRGDILSGIYKLGHVRQVEYTRDGMLVDCELHQKQLGRYRRFVV